MQTGPPSRGPKPRGPAYSYASEANSSSENENGEDQNESEVEDGANQDESDEEDGATPPPSKPLTRSQGPAPLRFTKGANPLIDPDSILSRKGESSKAGPALALDGKKFFLERTLPPSVLLNAEKIIPVSQIPSGNADD